MRSAPTSSAALQVSGSPSIAGPRPGLPACRARRDRIASKLDCAALVLCCGRPGARSASTFHRFRPDSDFYYLTGLAEPGAVMVLRPGHDEPFTLFVRPLDRDAEIWSGRRVGPEGAKERFGADAAHPLDELAEKLPDLLDGVRRVALPIGERTAATAAVHRALGDLRRRNRTGTAPPELLVDARALLGEERIVKDPAALQSLRRAVDITIDAHLDAMDRLRPGMHEFEVEAILEHGFRSRGASGPGYGTIVGAGANATVLHYVDNDGVLGEGDLLLIDAGAEWDLHTGDLTRTLPVSGRFAPAQRDLYDIVLEANRAGIARAVVGSDIDAIHQAALDVLVTGLMGLGLLPGSKEEIVEQETYKRFYMHRTSHWLGADVHDAGYYCIDRQPRPLQPGFVLTVEPGLYVHPDDQEAPAEMRGIGIRIEDDVLVTADGPEVLTHRAPKLPADLEARLSR